MENKDWKLFQPITVNGLQLKNRIALLPMGNKLHSSIGEVTPKLINFYEEVARGGTGLIIVQAAYVTDEFGGTRLRIDSDDFVSGLNELAESIRSWGARAAIQIAHRGYLSSGGFTINDLDELRIQKLIEAFGKGAERAKRAGFEMVEIHGAHGYLIPQFLSGLTNKRTDGYGGNLERRMTFALQVYRRVRQALGENFPISFRMSADEYLPGGINLDDAQKIAIVLEKEGVDLISVSAGKADTREWIIQPMALPRGCLATLSQAIKRSVKIPILVAGRINDPILANSILEEGKADLIGMGRGLMADPWLPQKAFAGRLDEIRKCIACNYCHGKRLMQDLPMKCTINPEAGRGRETSFLQLPKRKRVLIVGGGPAGMECAYTLQQRGHEVLLFEKASLLGGKLRIAAIPPHKEEISEFLEFLVRRTEREKIPLFLDHEVNGSTVQDIRPDVIVFAMGAKPIFPDILGLRREFCYTAEEALTQDFPGDQIIVLGGGLVGCEVTEYLQLKGKKVTLVEQLPEVGLDLEPTTRKLLLRRILVREPIIRNSTEIVRIEKRRAFFRDQKGNESSSNFDAVVLAVGFSPDNKLTESIEPPGFQTYRIGDCLTPRGILEAIHEGNWVGLTIGN